MRKNWKFLCAMLMSIVIGFSVMVACETGKEPAPTPTTEYTITAENGSGGGKYAENSYATIVANDAQSKFAFVEWQEGTTAVSKDKSYTFKVTKNRTFKAVYEQADFTVTVNGGTGGGAVKKGQEVTVTANDPAAHFTFDGWKDGDNIVSKNKVFTFIAKEDRTLTATYVQADYKVTVEGGAIKDYEGTEAWFNKNSTVTVVAQEKNDFIFNGWKNKATDTIVSTTLEYSFALEGNIDLVSDYSAVPYSVWDGTIPTEEAPSTYSLEELATPKTVEGYTVKKIHHVKDVQAFMWVYKLTTLTFQTGIFKDAEISIEANLDFNGMLWNGFDIEAPEFDHVVFNGNGNIIKNMRVDSKPAAVPADTPFDLRFKSGGFINTLGNANYVAFKDLTFKNAQILGDIGNGGVLIGFMYAGVEAEAKAINVKIIDSGVHQGNSAFNGIMFGQVGAVDNPANCKVTIKDCAIENSAVSGLHTVAAYMVAKATDTSTVGLTIQGNNTTKNSKLLTAMALSERDATFITYRNASYMPSYIADEAMNNTNHIIATGLRPSPAGTFTLFNEPNDFTELLYDLSLYAEDNTHDMTKYIGRNVQINNSIDLSTLWSKMAEAEGWDAARFNATALNMKFHLVGGAKVTGMSKAVMDSFNAIAEDFNPGNKVTLKVNKGQGSGQWYDGHSVFVKANIPAHHSFVKWVDGEGAEVSTLANFAYKLDGDAELTPIFKIDTFNVTIENGTFISGWNTEITLVPEVKEGYKFLAWVNGDKVISSEENYTFFVTEDITLKANYYREFCDLTITDSGVISSVEGNPTTAKINGNTSVTVTADEEDDNNVFLGWYEGNDKVSSDRVYTFTIMENHTLSAKFERSVNITLDTQLTVTGLSASGKAPLGESVTLSVPAPTNDAYNEYEAVWTVGATEHKGLTYTFDADENMTIKVEYRSKYVYSVWDGIVPQEAPDTWVKEGDNYRVKSASAFVYYLYKNFSYNTTFEKTLILDCNIDFNNQVLPFANGSACGFGFTFNGNNKILKNFIVTSQATGSEYYAGIIGIITGSNAYSTTFKDLNIINGRAIGNDNNDTVSSTGLLIGRTISCALNLTNINVYNSYAGSTATRVGALVGYVDKENAKVTNCSINSSVVSGLNMVGGLMGFTKNASITTSNCTIKDTKIYAHTKNNPAVATSHVDNGNPVALAGCEIIPIATNEIGENTYHFTAIKSMAATALATNTFKALFDDLALETPAIYANATIIVTTDFDLTTLLADYTGLKIPDTVKFVTYGGAKIIGLPTGTSITNK